MRNLDHATCAEVFRRLDAYVDRELRPDEIQRVRAHLEICAICAAEIAFETSLLEGLRAKLRHLQVPGDLAATIHRLLQEADPDA